MRSHDDEARLSVVRSLEDGEIRVYDITSGLAEIRSLEMSVLAVSVSK